MSEDFLSFFCLSRHQSSLESSIPHSSAVHDVKKLVLHVKEVGSPNLDSNLRKKKQYKIWVNCTMYSVPERTAPNIP